MKPVAYTNLAPSRLAMHRDSRAISKPKPKIRVIYVVEPKIIHTDVQNFREVVQKLTGKPAEKEAGSNCKNPSRKITGLFPTQDVILKRDKEDIIYEMENNPSYHFLSFLGDIVDPWTPFINDVHDFPVLNPFGCSSQLNTCLVRCLCVD